MLQAEQVLQECYQLKQQIGLNASRQTWLAQDVSTQEKVAIKLLTFSDQVQWKDLRLFEREAQILKQLNHQQIPQYRNYFVLEDRILLFALVQEYIPSVSFRELLDRGQVFTEAEVRKIAESVLKILTYLHQLNPPVLHRDIKPSNLLMGEDSQIYLVDFGAVQDRAAAEGATFTVVGTYGYTPLEQFGGRATPASDLYALGATLIHLLTGVPPADLPQFDSRLQFAPLVELNPGFVRWLGRMTEPNLERRFSNAQEALDALQENQVAITVINQKPPHSNIQLKKSPHRLQIKIPIFWNKLVKTRIWFAGLGIYVLLIGFQDLSDSFPHGWAYLIVGLVMTSWYLVSSLLQTQVYFDHQRFEIEWKLFGFCLKRQRGNVLEIDEVFVSDDFEITLAVGVQEYSFSRLRPPLTEKEYRWLAEEIKCWLGI